MLVKLQIDNSLDLGWEREDIMLATNFDYEYNGVKSIVVSDDNFSQSDNPGSKHLAICELISRGLIKKGELYWFHDLDAFQSETITESELGMDGADLALTDYGWRERWATGSMFFAAQAEDIFRILLETANLFKIREEFALMVLTYQDRYRLYDEQQKEIYNPEMMDKVPMAKDIQKRVKKINTSYNFVPFYNTKYCYEIAIKPIKVVHFHPFGSFKEPDRPSLINFYMYGDNDIKTTFMSERLIKIFHEHGIR